MAFKSINEIEKFRFDDCQISRFEVNEQGIELELEALIVKADNSQNANYTESYAATTRMQLVSGKILHGKKDGYKYYDANDVLISEVADTELTEDELGVFPKQCAGAYLYEMKKESEAEDGFAYTLGIEFEDPEDGTVGDSYRLRVAFVKAVVTWERYMNRVQTGQ